jgi:hypothetical protein
MQPRTNRANRGNVRGGKIIGEQARSLLMQRVFLRDARTVVRVCRHVGAPWLITMSNS